MDRYYPSALRIRQRLQFRQRVMAGACAGIAVCAMAFGVGPDRDPIKAPLPELEMPAPLASPVPLAEAAPAVRRIYRYSVFPGGAANQAELARIIRSDKVVAAHYAGFDVDKARAVTVTAPRAVYVSYRKGDQVYWTAKKVMLEAGETLLTDGRNEMRARCANRISESPRFPVEAHGPHLEALDAFEDVTEGDITFINAPDLEDGDLPELAGQPFQPVWHTTDPAPAGTPARTRTPLHSELPAALPWPRTRWYGNPDAPVLATLSPPPQSGAFPVDPLPGVEAQDPLDRMPPPGANDPDPFIPGFDPGQPAAPSNPPLDLPEPSDVPEPASPWLVAAALVAMRTLRRRR